jgi:hypothetical protein
MVASEIVTSDIDKNVLEARVKVMGSRLCILPLFESEGYVLIYPSM